MKKLLILSDSHRNESNLRRIFAAEQDADVVLFLGDGLHDLDRAAPLGEHTLLYTVAGNCDYDSFAPGEGLVAFEKLAIFYTHGHMYGVKSGLDRIAQAAESRGADIALFGHTHRPCCEQRGNVLLFNPGSAGAAYGACTYGVLVLDDGKILSAEHREVPKRGLFR